MTVSPPPRTITITVFADVGCPWTYLALHALRRALALCAYLPVRFELELRTCCAERAADLPPGAREPRAAYLARRFGPAGAEGRLRLVRERAKKMGVPLNLDGEIAQAARAHALLAHAHATRGAAAQQALLGDILTHVFVHGACVDDTDALVECALDAGLFGGRADAARAFLDAVDPAADERATAAARALGIGAGPCAVVGRWAVAGGQSAEAYARIFRRLAESGQHSCRMSLPLVSATA